MGNETITAVGLERIGQGVGAEERIVFAAQIGVTRIGAGGRCPPRCRSGRMASTAALVASTSEPQEFITLPRRAVKSAPLARAVAFLTVAVLVCVNALRNFSVLAAIGRVLLAVLVGRPGRLYRWRASWSAVWRGGERLVELVELSYG